jgi:hypothetical protein
LSGYKAIGLLKPDFDRSGRKLSIGWIPFILTLGGGSVKAGAFRGTVVARESFFYHSPVNYMCLNLTIQQFFVSFVKLFHADTQACEFDHQV